MSDPPRGRVHRRVPIRPLGRDGGGGGTAVCGCPARQDQLTDELEDVTCRECWEAQRQRAWAS